MDKRTSTENARQQRQILKSELAAAREEIYQGSRLLRSSVSLKGRAKAFFLGRPGIMTLTTLAAVAAAVRFVPARHRRSKGGLMARFTGRQASDEQRHRGMTAKSGLLARFTGELAKGAAGAALPFLLNRLSRFQSRPVPPPPDPAYDLPPRITSDGKSQSGDPPAPGQVEPHEGSFATNHAGATRRQ